VWSGFQFLGAFGRVPGFLHDHPYDTPFFFLLYGLILEFVFYGWAALIWRLVALGVEMVEWATAVTLTTALAWGGWDGSLTLTIMSYGIQ
jgi:hypothetical protein